MFIVCIIIRVIPAISGYKQSLHPLIKESNLFCEHKATDIRVDSFFILKSNVHFQCSNSYILFCALFFCESYVVEMFQIEVKGVFLCDYSNQLKKVQTQKKQPCKKKLLFCGMDGTRNRLAFGEMTERYSNQLKKSISPKKAAL